jgi:hypothetical protein
MTIAMPGITTRLPKKKLSWPYVLQTVSEETLPVLKEAQVDLNLRRGVLQMWVFVTKITGEFILGLDIL